MTYADKSNIQTENGFSDFGSINVTNRKLIIIYFLLSSINFPSLSNAKSTAEEFDRIINSLFTLMNFRYGII